MAISAPTKTSDLSGFITPEDAAPIFERAARESVVTLAAVEVRPSAEQRQALAAETASQGTGSVGSAAIAAALAQLSAVLPAVRPVPVHLHGLVVEAAAQLVKH